MYSRLRLPSGFVWTMQYRQAKLPMCSRFTWTLGWYRLKELFKQYHIAKQYFLSILDWHVL